MPIDVPDPLKGYWGPIASAASGRLGIAGAFQAVNDARAANGLDPLSGVDAISMGRMYSLAVAQRNAGQMFQDIANAVAISTGTELSTLLDTPISSPLITETISSGSAALQATMPTFKIQYQVLEQTPQGPVTSFRWINLGNEVPQTVGEVLATINEVNDLVQSEHGTSLTPTGFVNIFVE